MVHLNDYGPGARVPRTRRAASSQDAWRGRSIYVRGLLSEAAAATDDALRATFGGKGAITEVFVVPERGNGRFRLRALAHGLRSLLD